MHVCICIHIYIYIYIYNYTYTGFKGIALNNESSLNTALHCTTAQPRTRAALADRRLCGRRLRGAAAHLPPVRRTAPFGEAGGEARGPS